MNGSDEAINLVQKKSGLFILSSCAASEKIKNLFSTFIFQYKTFSINPQQPLPYPSYCARGKASPLSYLHRLKPDLL
jgi:hypothetical protein